MKNNLKLIFAGIELFLSHMMCIHVAYAVRDMQCGVQHMGYSAPVSAAFLYALPYLAGMLICAAVCWVIESKNNEKNSDPENEEKSAEQEENDRKD